MEKSESVKNGTLLDRRRRRYRLLFVPPLVYIRTYAVNPYGNSRRTADLQSISFFVVEEIDKFPVVLHFLSFSPGTQKEGPFRFSGADANIAIRLIWLGTGLGSLGIGFQNTHCVLGTRIYLGSNRGLIH